MSKSTDVSKPTGPTGLRHRLAQLKETRVARAWKRYSDVHGNVLAAGVGYFSFFSIFPAVALAFTVFGFVLRGNPDLLKSVTDQLSHNLPGFVKDAEHPDGIIPTTAPGVSTLGITGAIAFVTLVLAGLGWLGAVREGIRAVFGLQGSVGNPVMAKIRDLGVLFTLGVGIVLSAILTSAVGSVAGWIADHIGMSGQGWVLTVAGLAVSIVADTGLMLLLLRVLSGVVAPWRELLPAALLGGTGFSLLKLSAAALLPHLTGNPLFASIAIVVGLLIWLNLIARLTLIAAAWAANDLEKLHGKELPGTKRQLADRPTGKGTADGVKGPGVKRPGRATMPVAATVRDAALPTFGTRSADRTTLAAGAVIGMAGALAMGALMRALRSALSIGRRTRQ